jgi:hypothetical protein
MKKLYKMTTSKKPRHFYRFERPAQTEVYRPNKRTSVGKRGCMKGIPY